ncbi:cullin-1-like [Sesamum indicum]|uniref:Cullin-1-like n=1 Tax=Sesamum indicum TaxID=4182 RepID=A0A6I9TTY4_SESIN|nr:cullin-1-like [Sesamum indicum]
MAAGAVRPLTFEEAWPFLQEEAINRIIDGLDGVETRQFTSEEYMRIYTTVYNVCEPNPIGPEVQKLYDYYKKTFEDYISSKVLPSLRGKQNEQLLQELLRRWKIHKTMTYWMSRFFHYLDRYYTVRRKLPSLVTTANLAFYHLVYGEMNDQVRDAVLSLIDREREGEEIDKGIVREAIDIYVEIADGSRKYYVQDFEEAMMKATTAFYSRKALDWITNQTYQDYMLKVEECLNQEKGRVSDYLKFRSKYNVVEIVQHELLVVHASKLEEKKRVSEAAA